MKPDRPSQTALLGAAHRAYHFMRIRPALLEDSEAIWLVGSPLSVILRVAPLRWLLWEPLLAKTRPISTFVVVRSRYAEDRLSRAIDDGYQQYVILGAGLDSWALRNPPSNVNVFELDHPATQRWKESRIKDQLVALPSHLNLIPIDFEAEPIADVLDTSSFDAQLPSFVSWLGTAYYLERETIEATLASIVASCAPGSRLVFDYFLPKSMMSDHERDLFEVIDQGGTKRGEPLKTLLDPDEVAAILQSNGFRVVEDVSALEIRRRYLNHRSDGLDIPDFARLCHAESVGVAG